MIANYYIVVDGLYYCGESELVSNPDEFNAPWSGNSFYVKRIEKTPLLFSRRREDMKIIEGRINLSSHIRRIMDSFHGELFRKIEIVSICTLPKVVMPAPEVEG